SRPTLRAWKPSFLSHWKMCSATAASWPMALSMLQISSAKSISSWRSVRATTSSIDMALPFIRSEFFHRGLRELRHDVIAVAQALLDLAALHQLVDSEIPGLLAQQSVDVVVLRLGKGVHSRGDLVLRHV